MSVRLYMCVCVCICVYVCVFVCVCMCMFEIIYILLINTRPARPDDDSNDSYFYRQVSYRHQNLTVLCRLLTLNQNIQDYKRHLRSIERRSSSVSSDLRTKVKSFLADMSFLYYAVVVHTF